MATLTADDLDSFVAKTDSLGGPGTVETQHYWSEFGYKSTVVVNQELDPFSDEYFRQQINLYHELSERTVQPHVNELTKFDIEHHVRGPNPYANCDPSRFAIHFLRLGIAIESAQLPPSPSILDMGAGWDYRASFLQRSAHVS